MAKSTYLGVAGTAHKVKKLYMGIDGKARKVKKGYIGVNGVARQFFSSGVEPGLYILGGYDGNLYRFDTDTMAAVNKIAAGAYYYGAMYTEPSTKIQAYGWMLIPCGATDSQAFITRLDTRVTTFLDPMTGAVLRQITRTEADPLLSGGNQNYVFGTLADNNGGWAYRYFAYDQDTLALKITSPRIGTKYYASRVTGGWTGNIYTLSYDRYRDDGSTYCRGYLDCYDLSTGAFIRSEASIGSSGYSRPDRKKWLDNAGIYRYMLDTQEAGAAWASLLKQDTNTLATVARFGGSGGSYGDVMTPSDYKRMESLFVVKG